MDIQLPSVDFSNPEWRWPAWKFGLGQEELFTTLYARYNTQPSPIQTAEAFHHDVQEIARHASSADEFHSLLAERKAQRLREMREAFDDVADHMTYHASQVPERLLGPSMHFFHHRSMDMLVQFFATFFPAVQPPHVEQRCDVSSTPAPAPSTQTSASDKPNTVPDDFQLPAASLPPTPPRSLRSSEKSPERLFSPPPPPSRHSPRTPGSRILARGHVTKRRAPPRRAVAASRRSAVKRSAGSPDGQRYDMRPRRRG